MSLFLHNIVKYPLTKIYKFNKKKIPDVQRNNKMSKMRGKSNSKNTLNHYKQIWMIYAESSHTPVKNCFLLFYSFVSFQPTMALVLHPGILVFVTCSNVPLHQISIILNGIPIQSVNTCKKGKNRQLLTLLSCSFTTYIH